MDYVQSYNAIEAVWWIGLGVFLASFPMRPDSRRHRRALAVALIVFGLTDVIEIQTGAWWRPWWLAVFKVACGLAIGMLVLKWFRHNRGSK